MKKIIATIILASLLTTTSAVFTPISYADTVQTVAVNSETLQKVLATVKTKVEIPEKLTEFSSRMEYNSSTKKNTYCLYWRTKDDNTSIEVSADENGNILFYNFYDTDTQYKDWNIVSKISKNDVLPKIEANIKKMLGDRFSHLEYAPNSSDYSPTYYFQYNRVENGHKVIGDYAYVTARLVGDEYIITNIYSQWSDANFDAPTDIINKEDALKAFKEKSNFELRYLRDYKTKNAKLEYGIKNGDSVYIDAKTGELVKPDSEYYAHYSTDMASMKEERNTGGSFTDSELADLAAVANLKKADELEKELRLINEIDLKDFTLSDYNYYKSSDDKYYAHLNFNKDNEKYLFIIVNAQTGKLNSVSTDLYLYRGDVDKEIIKLSDAKKEAAQAASIKFMQNYCNSDFANAKLVNSYTYGSVVCSTYSNFVNDIPYYSDSITISYDAESGYITNLTTYWEETKEFESADKVVDLDTAFTTLSDANNFNTVYVVNKENAILSYGFEDDYVLKIDAITGKPLNVYGTTYTEGGINYSDITGHWCEPFVNALKNKVIAFDGNEFKPDQAITQKEYFQMLYNSDFGYNFYQDIDEVYNYMIRRKIITKDEKAPDSNVTKEQAVVYLIKMMGHSDVADLKNIFISHFADNDNIADKYIGYVAIANGLGLVKGNDNNEFEPQKTLSRAETASIFYNYLIR